MFNLFSISIGLVYQELAVGPDEEQCILLVLLAYPAAAVLAVDNHVAVFATHLLLGKQLVVLVVYLQIGMSVRVIDKGEHIVTTYSVCDKVDIVSLAGIVPHHNHIGHMVVIPIAVAVVPEAGPEVWAWGERIPIQAVAMHYMVMMRVHEVGCGVHRAMRGRHVTARVARMGISTCRCRSNATGTASGSTIPCGVAATRIVATANGTAIASSTVAHGRIATAADF